MASETGEILVFEVAGQRCGALLADVVEVLRAVTISSLPKAPPVIEGIINIRGSVVPVLDVRARFDLPRKPVDPTDQFVVVRTGRRVVALRVDQATDIVRIGDDGIVSAREVLPSASHVAGIAKLKDGLILIYDLPAFLSQAENEQLGQALNEMAEA